MKRRIQLFIFTVVGLIYACPLFPRGQSVRAYKMIDRGNRWCVQIVDCNGKGVSRSSFTNHSAGVWVPSLAFKFQANNPDDTNTIRVFKKKACSGTPDIERTIRQGDLTPNSQIHIEENGICIVENNDLEPADEPTLGSGGKKMGLTVLVGAIKTDPATYRSRWKIVTSANSEPTSTRLSALHLKKETRLNENLAILKNKPTWVFVYTNPSSGQEPIVTELSCEEIGRIVDSNEKGVLLINANGAVTLETSSTIKKIENKKRSNAACAVLQKQHKAK